MAQKTVSGNGNTTPKVADQSQSIVRAIVAPDGTITIPKSEANLSSVEVADVDLLLSFSDGTFVVVPNGALDAIGGTPPTVLFNDSRESLGSLFKMVSTSNLAKAGSLRVVSGNVDAPSTQAAADEPKPPEKDLWTSSDPRLSETVSAPAPLVKVGKGSAPFNSGSNGPSADSPDPVLPPKTSLPPSYSDPQGQTHTATSVGDTAPPVVTAGQTFNYTENRAADTVVATVGATDDVGVKGYHFSATHADTSADGFYIIGANGQISITAAGVAAGVAQNHFEAAHNSFNYGIEAIDAAGNVSAAQDITLSVTDVQDSVVDITPPVITPGQTFSYAENQVAGAVVAAVLATDDIGVTGFHFSETHSGTSADGFYTIGATGQIHISAAGIAAGVAQNDFETTPNSFIYGIEAIDAAGNASAVQNVTLNVTNVDENTVDVTPPVVVVDQTFSYSENQVSGAMVAVVAASDNVGVTGFRFSDSGTNVSSDMYFSIGANGQISITAAGAAAGVAQNDFEMGFHSFSYGIVATDSAGNVSAAQNIILNVTDVNEAAPVTAAPVITVNQAFSYTENQTANTVVATVAATDDIGVTGFRFSDGGKNISHDGFYAIGANGQISITAAGVAAEVAQNDFEMGVHSFNYGIVATDAEGNASAMQNITFNVTNVDEAAPVVISGQSFYYAENQTAGAVVAAVAATDDIGVTGYRFSDGAGHFSVTSPDNYFSIGDSGQIRITADGVAHGVAQNDFETELNSFSYSVVATDAAGHTSAVQNITLNVTNVDDAAPVLVADQVFNYAENQLAGSVVAIIAATDDVAVSGFHFSANNSSTSADGFYFIEANGQIHITDAGAAHGIAQNDFETGLNSFSYGIEAVDAVGHVSAVQNITFNVTNVDEARPVVIGGQSFNYAENQQAEAVVGAVAATDDIGVVAYHFSNSGANISSDKFFSIESNGQIRITADGVAHGVAQNDFETGLNSFSYGIVATDAAGNDSPTQNITLNVTNVDEEAPKVSTGQSFNYAENQVADAVVAVVAATDDIGVTGYRFSDGSGHLSVISPDTFYSIGDNGQISITSAGVADGVAQNDFEKGQHSFSYNIVATDATGNESSAQSITLNVTNVDDTAPLVVVGQSFSYAENQLAGAVVGIVAATDDFGITGFRFSDGAGHLTTATPDGFYSIGDSGQISINAAADGFAQNDFEKGPLHIFPYNIVAIDAVGHVSDAQSITLNVTNVDEQAPVVTSQTLNYVEHQLAGAVVAVVAATDDVGVTGFSFNDGSGHLTATSPDGYYSIGANGQITITDSGAASQNTYVTSGTNNFSYGIVATDAVGHVSILVGTNVTLNIVDQAISDNAVPVVASGQTFSYAENQIENAVVATVAATDDIGVTGFQFSATLTGTSADGFYTIGANGQIHITADGVAHQNDFETGLNTYSYGIVATDASTKVSLAQSITLNVTNVDETAPVVVSGQTFSYVENQLPDTVVAIVAASDDIGVTGFSFSDVDGHLTATSHDGYYSIEDNGQIRITSAGTAANIAQNDFETLPNSFNYDIVATDAVGHVSSVQSITFNVTNKDDAIPVVIADQVFNYAENQLTGAVVAIVAATDDVGVIGYHFSVPGTEPGTSSDGYYSIGANGQIRITAEGVSHQNDFEAGVNSYVYGIVATDAAGNVSVAQNITLNVTDVNEAPAAPFITSILDDIDPNKGDIANGGYTNDTTPTISGTAEANSLIKLYDGVSIVTSVVADGSGNWSYISDPLADGTNHSYSVTATNTLGFVSDASASHIIHIDTSATTPAITGAADNVGTIQGNIVSGGSTNDLTPTLSGIAEGNSIISLYDGYNFVATVIAGESGSWSYTLESLVDGSDYSYTIKGTDPAGNISEASAVYALHIDNSPPSTPVVTAIIDNAGTVPENIKTGDFTNDRTPTFTGTAEAYSTVSLYDGGNLVVMSQVDSSGNWSCVPVPLNDGSSHTYTLTATDAVGNVSAPSAEYILNIDTTAPLTPVIVEVRDDVDPVLKNLSTGDFTNDTTPTFSGTAEVHSTVSIYDHDILVATIIAGDSGSWSYTPEPLGEGSSHIYTVTATDSAGNVSAATAHFDLSVDTKSPSIPTIEGAYDDVLPGVGNVAAGITNDKTPTLFGSAEAFSTVSLFDGETFVSTVITDVNGKWRYISDPLDYGTNHTYTAIATDAAGNFSAHSTAYVLQINETMPPPPPVISGASDDVSPVLGPITNGITNDTTPTISGTSVANITVNLFDSGVFVATVIANGSGLWNYTLPSDKSLSDGSDHSFTATATDFIGLSSESSGAFSLHIDATPPPKPIISGASDNAVAFPVLGPITNGVTNDTTPTLFGTAEAYSIIKFVDGATPLATTATADASGNWSYTTATLANGSSHSYTVTATDLAGNLSTASTAYALRIDTTIALPTITGVDDNVGIITGPITKGGATDDATPTFSGSAEANSTVSLYDNNIFVASVTAGTGGLWNITPANLNDGSHLFTVKATDAAGNVSGTSAAFAFATDTIKPSTPIITGANDDVGDPGTFIGLVTNNGTTNDTRPTLVGTAEANANITIYHNGIYMLGVYTSPSGTWSYTTDVLGNGSTHSYSVTCTDNVGNISNMSAVYTVNIDTSSATPVITGAKDDVGTIQNTIGSGGSTNDPTPTLTGTAEANSTIKISDGSTLLVTTATADAGGVWNYTTAALADGSSHSYTAVATDPAGNKSATSTAFIVKIDTSTVTPVITGAVDNVGTYQGPIANGDTTNDSTPTLSGTAEAGSSVSVYDNNLFVSTVTANSGGVWSFTPNPLSDNSNHSYTVRATDVVGNVSAYSSALAFHIDIAPPSIPAITGVINDVGPVPITVVNGNSTNDATPILTGTSDANTTVNIFDNGVFVSTVTAGAGGDWNYTTATLVDGSKHIYTATATNVNGGTSTASPSYTVNIDTTAPNVPVVAPSMDSNFDITGNFTISGVETGAHVEYSSNGTDWSTIAPAVSTGYVYVHQVDLAGNLSLNALLDITCGSGLNVTLVGDVNDNILIGTAGDDILNGGSGHNVLYGNAGNDSFIGGAGYDDMYGGSGIDTVSYAGSYSSISASLTSGLGTQGDASDDTYHGVENMIGSVVGGDHLIGDANTNVLTGGAGGNNTLEGMAGADELHGGGGTNNTASYEHAAQGVTASLANSTANGGTDAIGDTYYNIQNLIGSAYNDTLVGDSQDNILTGGAGDDKLYGGAGHDTIYANQGHDSAYGGDNNDTFFVSSLPANPPTVIDGGARDAGPGGNVMILQNLVSGSYDMSALSSHVTNIDTLNIKGDGAATNITISVQDIHSMVNGGTSPTLYVEADAGDKLVLAANESITQETGGLSYIDYTITNAATAENAHIHWHTA